MGTSNVFDDMLRAYLESIGFGIRADERESGFYSERQSRTPIASYEANGIQYEVYDHV